MGQQIVMSAAGGHMITGMAVDGSGNLYAVGGMNNLVTGSSSTDWFVKKYSPAGLEDTTNWNKKFNGTANDTDWAESVAIDSGGNVYVAGYTIGSGSGGDWRIKKYSSAGVEDTSNWNKNISFLSVGGDQPKAVAIDSSNGVYVAGWADNATSYANWQLKKYSSSGVEDATWNKSYSSVGMGTDYLFAMTIDSNGNVYAAGLFATAASITGRIKKFSPLAVEDAVNWDKTISQAGADTTVTRLTTDKSGNVYVAGTTSNEPWIRRYTSGGVQDSRWSKNIAGTNSSILSLLVDKNGDLYVAGYANNLSTGTSSSDGFVRKFWGN